MKQSGVLRKAYLIKYEGTSKAGDGKSLREILPRSPHQLRGAPPGQARKLLVQGKLVGGVQGHCLVIILVSLRRIFWWATKGHLPPKPARLEGRKSEWNESDSETDSTDGLLLSFGGIQVWHGL